jgi:hypothetical protein
MAKTLYKSSHRALGKEAWRIASLVLQKNDPRGKHTQDKIIVAINTLWIHA